ncbi:MAG: hypothetical protein JRG76_01195 [Deltaproteobacteria bacterium]|nr:hypothetical protein [Deltaproteobacteria bacterium]MBW2413099.1 hypothetical protein [Deltaproteobacteria bacterium]
MGDRPTKSELLEAVRRFLDEDLLPELEGVRRFHARVASNALGIVAREIEQEPDALPVRYAKLAALMGRAGEAPSDLAGLDAAVDELEASLCERIRRGDADEAAFRAEVFAYLRESVGQRLAVANPTYR